jgi:hypothetical protein
LGYLPDDPAGQKTTSHEQGASGECEERGTTGIRQNRDSTFLSLDLGGSDSSVVLGGTAVVTDSTAVVTDSGGGGSVTEGLGSGGSGSLGYGLGLTGTSGASGSGSLGLSLGKGRAISKGLSSGGGRSLGYRVTRAKGLGGGEGRSLSLSKGDTISAVLAVDTINAVVTIDDIVGVVVYSAVLVSSLILVYVLTSGLLRLIEAVLHDVDRDVVLLRNLGYIVISDDGIATIAAKSAATIAAAAGIGVAAIVTDTAAIVTNSSVATIATVATYSGAVTGIGVTVIALIDVVQRSHIEITNDVLALLRQLIGVGGAIVFAVVYVARSLGQRWRSREHRHSQHRS